MATSY